MAKLSMSESYPFATPTENMCRTPSTYFQPQSAASHQKLLLFVAGFQNTSLIVLLEKEAENDADLIHLLVNIINFFYHFHYYDLYVNYYFYFLVEFKS